MSILQIELPAGMPGQLDRLATEMKIDIGALALRAIIDGLPIVRGVRVAVPAKHASVPAARILEAHQALAQGMSSAAGKLAEAMEAMEAAGTARG